MTMMWLLSILLVGVTSGWVMGTSAAGWGALSVPLLILIGVEPLVAISSSLTASIILGLFGGLTHWGYDRARVAPLVPLLLGGAGGAVLGSLLSPALPTPTLRLLIGLTTLGIGVVTLFRKNGFDSQGDPGREAVKWKGKRAALFGIGAVAGVSAGAFGVGWGTVGVALLVWTGIPPHTVVGSSLVVRALVALSATGSYLFQAGVLRVEILFPLLIAGAAGVYLGVWTSNGFSANGMRKFIGCVVTMVGILTIIKVLW